MQAVVVGENDVGAQAGAVGGRCLDDGAAANCRLRQRRLDPAEIRAVQQINILVFSKRHYQV